MININFLKFMFELKIKGYNIEKRKFSFILNLYQKNAPLNLEEDLKEKFQDNDIYSNYLKNNMNGMRLSSKMIFYTTRKKNIEDEKENEVKYFIDKFKKIDTNIFFDFFEFKSSDNVFKLLINNIYNVTLINNTGKENITLISIYNKKLKKINHFNIVLDYNEFNHFLKNYKETLEMNKDLFNMWSI